MPQQGMKIGYASDMHLEFGNQRTLELPEPVDVLVLAGDVDNASRAIDYGASFLLSGQARHVVQIAGNHECWKHVLSKVPEMMREQASAHENLHFLENESVEIDGWYFHGATTWTDYKLGGVNQALNMFSASQGMNDYKRIKFVSNGNYRKLKPQDLRVINERSREFLFVEIGRVGRDRSIVVTHHAPCHLSIPDKFSSDPLNFCYASDWGSAIAYMGPRLWFHGHIHEPSDYEVGDTRMICNPIGYPGQNNDSGFKVLELGQE